MQKRPTRDLLNTGTPVYSLSDFLRKLLSAATLCDVNACSRQFSWRLTVTLDTFSNSTRHGPLHCKYTGRRLTRICSRLVSAVRSQGLDNVICKKTKIKNKIKTPLAGCLVREQNPLSRPDFIVGGLTLNPKP